MPSNVLTALFGIIEHQELNPEFDNFSELPPSEKRRLRRWLKTVEAWLKDEGLKFENLVAVLAVPNRGKGPTLVFAFDDRNENNAESVREISLSL
jgi:hypothetical protein